MAEVCPDSNEESEVRSDEGRVEVVESFRRLYNVRSSRPGAVGERANLTLTARKKSLISWVM